MNIGENILNNNLKNINNDNVEIVPCNTNVILKFYDENPYRYIETTESGLILGIESKTHKSSDTGETEENQPGIVCAKVIAVGPACKNVKAGEDVYVSTFTSVPIPFRNKNYRAVTEQNIICRMVKND